MYEELAAICYNSNVNKYWWGTLAVTKICLLLPSNRYENKQNSEKKKIRFKKPI